MKISRKIQLTLYSLFTIVTFHKFYICEDCHKIHRFSGNEMQICGGWYEPYVYVSNKCAENTINKAYKILRESILKR